MEIEFNQIYALKPGKGRLMGTVDFEERGRLRAVLLTMTNMEAIHWLRNLAVWINYEIETRERKPEYYGSEKEKEEG